MEPREREHIVRADLAAQQQLLTTAHLLIDITQALSRIEEPSREPSSTGPVPH